MTKEKEKINFEIPAYLLGILSVVGWVSSPLMSLILGIIGLILSFKQETRLSKTSKILNIIGIIISIVILIVVIILSIKNPNLSSLIK
jgi:uncharacterized Tic20 family protein